MALFDANTLLLLLDPTLPAPIDKTTGKPVTEVKKRIKYLVSILQESRKKIVIPTPVLAEVLTHSDRAGGDYFTKINRSSSFRIEPFEIRAAIELARMTASSVKKGDKREGSAASWNKIKFDRQIVAIAKICRVSMIYSDDENLKKFANTHDIAVMTIGQLPLPPEDAQMNFVWDMAHEDGTTEDESED